MALSTLLPSDNVALSTLLPSDNVALSTLLPSDNVALSTLLPSDNVALLVAGHALFNTSGILNLTLTDDDNGYLAISSSQQNGNTIFTLYVAIAVDYEVGGPAAVLSVFPS